MDRRTLLNLAVTATALSPFYRLPLVAATEEFPQESLASLRRIARAVLPSTLGPKGADEQVERLAVWVREYREGAEMDHGYGRPRVRYMPASPNERYVSQIDEIDRASVAKGNPFDQLDREVQRGILAEAFTRAGVDTLPRRPAGGHVVADLMALYFRSTEANDAVYRAAIGRQTCRPLTSVVDRPRPV